MKRALNILVIAFISLGVFTFCSDGDKVPVVDYDMSGQWEYRDTGEYIGLGYEYVAIRHHVMSADGDHFRYTVHTKDSAKVENGEIIDLGDKTYEGSYSTVNGKILFNELEGDMNDWRGKVENDILFISSIYVDAEYLYDFHRVK